MAPHPFLLEPGAVVPDAALKVELRAASLAARDALDPEARRAASAAIARTLLDLPALAAVRCVAAYRPIRSEVDPGAAVDGFLARGQAVALPVVTPDGLVFRAWRVGDPLIRGRFGLSEPEASAPVVEPDALVVPLAAFDRAGQRIGYGRGYYDGAIARLSALHPVLTVGIGFRAQAVDRVPAEPHDRPLQWVITEAGSVRLEEKS